MKPWARLGLMKPYMRPISSGPPVAGSGGHRAGPARRQLDDPRGRRAMPARRHSRRRAAPPNTDGMFGELLATSSWRAASSASSSTRACATCRAHRNEISGLARAIPAQGTVKATLGSVNVPVVCAGAAGQARRRDRRRRRRRRRRARGLGREDGRRGRRARSQRGRQAGASSPPACWASTCTQCASRSRKPA